MHLWYRGNWAEKNVRIAFDNWFNQMLDNTIYNKLFAVNDTNERVEKFQSSNSVSLAKKMSGESQNAPTSQLDKGWTAVFSGDSRKNQIITSWEVRLAMKDDTLVIDTYLAREQAKVLDGFNVTINQVVHDYFNYAFTGWPTGTEFLAPDLEPFISAAHKRSPTNPTTFSNLLPASVIDETQISLLHKRGGSFKDPNGIPMPLRFDTLVVALGSDREREAKKIFGNYGGQYSPTTIGNVNIYQGDSMKMISTPYLADPKMYFFVDSRYLGDSIYGNPLFLHFEKRPWMVWAIYEDPNNFDYIYKFGWHRKSGIRNIPFARCGSMWV